MPIQRVGGKISQPIAPRFVHRKKKKKRLKEKTKKKAFFEIKYY